MQHTANGYRGENEQERAPRILWLTTAQAEERDNNWNIRVWVDPEEDVPEIALGPTVIIPGVLDDLVGQLSHVQAK
jgi:hypothetical protein